ncbi:MAG: divalent-cation tolerance protein CutA [Candidatus Delongbacteria bacterium]|nr:divalent-cation tolerance protein CutA [Candidatus Delongbacteria bacterium]
MTEWIQIVTTLGEPTDAERIARYLVEFRLAACVQVEGPIQSYYRWKGVMETAREWRCHIKTASHLYGEVQDAIRRLHPYELPEIVAYPLSEILPEYRSWMEESLKGND